jgi:hypothetical protein
VFVADSDDLKNSGIHCAGTPASGVHYCFLKLQNIVNKHVKLGLRVVDERNILQLN